MNTEDARNRIDQMIRLIKDEAEEKAKMIIEEAKQKMQKEKNKVYNFQREKLISEYDLKEEQDQVEKRLQKSRKINQTRLEMQNYRNKLLQNLKGELEEQLREKIRNKDKYKTLMKDLIMQGLIRLLEKNVVIKCRKKDVKLVTSLFDEIKKDFKNFLKKSIDQEPTVNLEIFKNNYLKEEEIGGVVLYCKRYKIVYDNSLRARLDLCFNDSIPDIRKMMFVSLK